MATMRDVAQRAGVSAKTVSRVFNNDRYVSADVRERVERAIDELRYVPNMLAVTFRAGRDAAIGVAVPGGIPSSRASSTRLSARPASAMSP
jgi:LacI family transcriptional regulator